MNWAVNKECRGGTASPATKVLNNSMFVQHHWKKWSRSLDIIIEISFQPTRPQEGGSTDMCRRGNQQTCAEATRGQEIHLNFTRLKFEAPHLAAAHYLKCAHGKAYWRNKSRPSTSWQGKLEAGVCCATVNKVKNRAKLMPFRNSFFWKTYICNSKDGRTLFAKVVERSVAGTVFRPVDASLRRHIVCIFPVFSRLEAYNELQSRDDWRFGHSQGYWWQCRNYIWSADRCNVRLVRASCRWMSALSVLHAGTSSAPVSFSL